MIYIIMENGIKRIISFVRTSSTAVLLGPHTRTRIFLTLILADDDEEAAWEVDAIGAAEPHDVGFRRLEPAITYD